MTETSDTWPAGATWVFQGTVAEDATGGTHVCTLTVTPGAGSELQVLWGEVVEGNTATAQATIVKVTDGTNILGGYYFNQDTSASIRHGIPIAVVPTANVTNGPTGTCPFVVSGGMNLILQVSTAAISVTQTFSVVCRIKGAMPTAVLADSVGTPALTVNTNKVF